MQSVNRSTNRSPFACPNVSPSTWGKARGYMESLDNQYLNQTSTEPNLNQTKPSLSISPVLHSRLSLVDRFGCVAESTHLCNVREGVAA